MTETRKPVNVKVLPGENLVLMNDREVMYVAIKMGESPRLCIMKDRGKMDGPCSNTVPS